MDFIIKNRFLLIASLLIVSYLAILAFVGINRNSWGDENHFYNTIQSFYNAPFSLHTLRHYEEMSTPLPFLAYALFGKIFGLALPTLRVLSLLVASATFFALFILFRYYVSEIRSLFMLGFVMINPYIAGLSLFVFTDMLALFFTALSFIAHHKKKPILLAISLAGSLLCRQYCAFLILSFATFYLYNWLVLKQKSDMKLFVAVLIGCIPLFSLFIFWHGTTPLNATRNLYINDGFSFHTSAITLYVSLCCLYLIPFSLVYLKKLYTHRIFIVSILVSSIYFFLPVQASRPALALHILTVGYIHKALLMIHPSLVHIIFYVGFLAAIPFIINSFHSIFRDIKTRSQSISTLNNLTIIAFLVIMPISYLTWEKYFILLFPVVLLQFNIMLAPKK